MIQFEEDGYKGDVLRVASRGLSAACGVIAPITLCGWKFPARVRIYYSHVFVSVVEHYGQAAIDDSSGACYPFTLGDLDADEKRLLRSCGTPCHQNLTAQESKAIFSRRLLLSMLMCDVMSTLHTTTPPDARDALLAELDSVYRHDVCVHIDRRIAETARTWCVSVHPLPIPAQTDANICWLAARASAALMQYQSIRAFPVDALTATRQRNAVETLARAQGIDIDIVIAQTVFYVCLRCHFICSMVCTTTNSRNKKPRIVSTSNAAGIGSAVVDLESGDICCRQCADANKARMAASTSVAGKARRSQPIPGNPPAPEKLWSCPLIGWRVVVDGRMFGICGNPDCCIQMEFNPAVSALGPNGYMCMNCSTHKSTRDPIVAAAGEVWIQESNALADAADLVRIVKGIST
jgi:hypothetical protein